MKKLYTFAFALVGSMAIAQEYPIQKIVNGGFEGEWTAQTAIEGITNLNDVGPVGNYNLHFNNANHSSQADFARIESTTEGVDGTNAIKFISPIANTTQGRLVVQDIPVTPGNQYEFSFQYKDNNDNVRGRQWCSWRSATADMDTDKDILQPNSAYIDNSEGDGFSTYSYTAIAPQGAVAFRIAYRVYKQNDGGGELILDNLSFIDNGPFQSIGENNIAGLRMYPNPTNGTTLYISTDSNDAKQVAIYDVLGKQVINTTVNNDAINISSLNAGVYIVKITEAGKTAARKLVVK